MSRKMVNPFLNIPTIEDLENRYLVCFVIKENSKMRKKVKHYVKKVKRFLSGGDIFILLFGKSYPGGPVLVNINLVSPYQ